MRVTKLQKKMSRLIVGCEVKVSFGKAKTGKIVEDLGPFGDGHLFKVMTDAYGELDLHSIRLEPLDG